GVVAALFGAIEFLGATSGGGDPLQPLAHLAPGKVPVSTALPFHQVRNVAELEAALSNPGKPVMLDFYADWCVSCKEMERFTFSDPDIQRRMSAALLLKADVTRNSAEERELLRRFKLFGPPGTVFFDAQGRELHALRVIGFQSSERFGRTLSAAGL
ncbi:MAG TPA: thioredoxin family protein, partial [Burkholderiaceae bacterium]|nr:thioredoxin family protein [Burkholderiaceae bacterium]